MKKRFLVILALITLLTTCREPGGGPTEGDPDKETTIVFDNTQGICAVTIYRSYPRSDENKIAQIPAGMLSQEFECYPGSSVPFFLSYQINFKGISGFTVDFVPPENAKNQIYVRVDPNIKNTITVPPLAEALASPDTLLSDKSYLLIQNNSSYPIQLLRGVSIINPDNISETVVNSGERAQYTVNPGGTSAYNLMVGGNTIPFPAFLLSFEAGRVYSFVYSNGALSLVSEIELKLENVAGVSPNKPVPPTPGAPVIISSDGLLTVHWTAVEGAEKYEVYISTTQNPPALPERTVYSSTAVLTGLYNRTIYYVWIKAVNENGASDFSPRARGIPWPANEVPAVPERPVIIPGINQLTVSWEDCGGASSYEVYVNTTPSAPSEPVVTSDKTSAVISYLGDGNILENGVIYYIWVRAVNNVGKSAYSPVEAGTPRIPTVAPAAPSRPVLTAGSRELSVSWQTVELTSAYEVWFGTSSDSSQAQKFGGDITDTEIVITGLVNETTYYVWVKAKNVVGASGFSLSANARPSALAVLPETPALPTVTIGSRELTVNWSLIEGALSYEVWMGATNNSAYAEKYGADISGTSTRLTNLNNGTTYYIWIKAKNNIGISELSPVASGTPSASAATPPDPQSAPTVTDGSGQLVLSWQAIEGAASYEVWAGTTNNPAAATKRGNDVSSTSATITGLSNGITYYVWIKAKNSVGISGFSPMASGTPSAFTATPQAPAVPIVLIGNGQITVSWTAVEGATAYEIWQGTANNSASAAKNGNDESALSRTISGLTNGTTYYIWIKAKNNVGTSGFSPTASGKPIGNATAPTLISSNGQLSVSWTAIAGADQYEVFYGTGVNPPQTASQTVNTTSATITGLTNGTIYNVWIRGRNSTGTGALSSPASAKPIGNMGTVTMNTGGSGQLILSWGAVAGADQYEIYRNTSNSIPVSPVQTVSVTTTTISGLTNGTTYYVWIKPQNTNGTGGTSAVVSGEPIASPGNLTLSMANQQITVSWAVVTGATSYEVYYSTSTTIPSSPSYTVTTTNRTLTGLINGTTYYFWVKAVNASGTSAASPMASGTPPGILLYKGSFDNDHMIGRYNFQAALTYISSNAVSGDNYFIVLEANESISPMSLSYSSKTVGITLLGYGGERTITLASNGSMFAVYSGVTITLDENITLVGRDSNNASLVTVAPNGYFIMNGGTIIGNTTSVHGGGISVAGGTFIMNSGTISGNTARAYGGGISIPNSGTVIINGGTISGNTAGTSGGGISAENGTVTMYGGVISGNTASTGGGILVFNGIFRKLPSGDGQNSGIIYGNEETGVDAHGIPLKNTVSGSYGHSVYSSSWRRNTTAGQTDYIDSTTGRGLSSSGNPPYGQ